MRDELRIEVDHMGADDEGIEEIVFSDLGVRFAIIQDDGTLMEAESFTPKMLGGTIPAPGDRFTTLWPKADKNDETYEVVRRHYVGEYHGDNCWWLLVRVIQPDRTDKALFEIARAVSAERRRYEKARAMDIQRALGKLGQKASTSRRAGAPHTPATLAEHWGVSANHVRNLIKRGELAHFKAGKLLRISLEAVRDYELANGMEKP